ncbi:MAG: glycosyltransferase [Candidatus Moranbacteria bacterium]|nr:glycosyltransferase [Candidatus Moranbacteria bacterium]
MKILLKIDKVRTLMRGNGFWGSLKIVFGYAKNYLCALDVPPGDILFVASGVGDSAHYRTHNVAEELNRHNFRASVTIVDNPNLLKLVDEFKIFIFHKTIYSEKISEVIAKIKAQKKEIIFDTDDLNFDSKFVTQMDYLKNAGEAEKVQLEKGLGREILEDDYVKVATTTTTYLAKILEEKNKKVFVVTNKISNIELEIANKLWETDRKAKDDFVYLGYFSGTPSHNKDFATITDALVAVMRKYANTKLILAGPLEKGNAFDEFEKRIITLPLVPRGEHYKNIQKADINLAPLESTPFCEAKSEIRFTGAGILGIPTVAVRNETFSGAIEDGVTGFLAGNTLEWTEKLGRLIEDENLRKEVGERAREKTLKDYTNKNSHSEEYYQYLKSKL